MKLNGIGKNINYSILMTGVLITLIGFKAHSGSMGPALDSSGKIYLGVFGGVGASTHISLIQSGTAFLTDPPPLAVNAFGKTNSRTVGIVGAHVGYQWPKIFSDSLNLPWGFVPAVELEGYYLSKSSFVGNDINNETERLEEHNFRVTYPLSTGVFLSNAVLNFNPSNLKRLHPYISAGIGAAVLSISNAYSLQVDPFEPNINHYNSNPNSTEATFAAQTKIGLNFDLSKNINVFAEYRWLYLSSTDYTFGSTVYTGGVHVPTSPWLVKINPQYYNMGAVGIQYSI